MDKYDIIEKLECAKINFKNSLLTVAVFPLAMAQLQEVIDELEKDDD